MRRSALLRYPFTSLPLGEFQSGMLTDESKKWSGLYKDLVLKK